MARVEVKRGRKSVFVAGGTIRGVAMQIKCAEDRGSIKKEEADLCRQDLVKQAQAEHEQTSCDRMAVTT